jgi:type IV secretion system protein VirB8
LLAQYVVARESFDINSIKGQYRRVGLWSVADARRDYLASIPANNPLSPINAYPRTALLDASVSSVDTGNPGKARVRFITERRDMPASRTERSWWVAEIEYRFTSEPMAAADRLVNPLGFAVTRYRRFQETAPQELPAVTTTGFDRTPTSFNAEPIAPRRTATVADDGL